eukprot:1484839-Alexandrium_andersonii.AAC.1
MSASLVGSEMCIRDSSYRLPGDLTSDDPYVGAAIPGAGSGDAEMEKTARLREAAAQARVAIRDR